MNSTDRLRIAAANISFATSLEAGRSLPSGKLEDMFKGPAKAVFDQVMCQPSKKDIALLMDQLEDITQNHIEHLIEDMNHLREFYLGDANKVEVV